MFVDVAKHLGKLFGIERYSSRFAEKLLGNLAASHCSGLDVVLSYNYMAHNVFPRCDARKVLFQCHPNPSALENLRIDHQDTGFYQEREIAWGPQYRKLLQKEYIGADLVIAPSTFVAESLVKSGADREKITVIPYGCESPKFSRTPVNVGRKKLLFVGQLVWRKGADLLPMIAERTKKTHDLIVVTRGLCDHSILQELVHKPNIMVYRDVPRRQLDILYRESHILLFPSRFEGYGLVLNEALTFGLPVVSTKNTALPDLLSQYQVGILAKSVNVDAICEAIDELSDEGAREQVGREVLRYVTANSWAKFRQRIYSEVERLCG
ncbi:MAG: glycosyltransferase family 4 protein [Pseudomonadales bacterium]|nr:glycosyltransferase family 4 protein [Pseudomonadales bacterium]